MACSAAHASSSCADSASAASTRCSSCAAASSRLLAVQGAVPAAHTDKLLVRVLRLHTGRSPADDLMLMANSKFRVHHLTLTTA